jgi:AcrR family transcriptional regulator
LPGHSLRTESRRGTGEELSKRQERAHRILDAAAELIQRWGYKKTAVDDIARLAGVAKGTIYLHWKTREDLFMALLLREGLEALKEMMERIESDPAGMYLSNVVKHSIYVIMTRPLARALFIQDVSVLGELLQQGREDLALLTQQKLTYGRQLLEFFRAKGVLRTDQSVSEQLTMYTTLVIGTMTVDQYLPADLRSSPAEATERLAAMIRDTLEPAGPLSPEVLSELKVIWDQHVQRLLHMLDERLQAEIA